MSTMNERHTFLFKAALLAIVIVSWAVAFGALPYAPARVVTHWGLDGQPNGSMGRVPGMLLPAAILTGVLALLHFGARIDPFGRNYPAWSPTFHFVQLATGLFVLALQVVTTGFALGILHDVRRPLFTLVSLLMIALGNVLGKLRPNWFVGIRTPWTLSSPDVWTLTHRFGGRVLVGVGGVMLLLALFVPQRYAGYGMFGLVIGWFVVSAGYSYVVWRRRGGSSTMGDYSSQS
ncbi:MAG: SdpI family protein [Herpetosiphon sp.]